MAANAEGVAGRLVHGRRSRALDRSADETEQGASIAVCLSLDHVGRLRAMLNFPVAALQ
jgi:hypothetical protein